MKPVALVGSAVTSRHLTPFDSPDVEIWGINEALMFPWMKRADAMFQMHRDWSFTRKYNHNHPGYWEWLQQPHPFPIYMLEKYPAVPAAVEYPLAEVIEALCKNERPYFTSTVAYMIALAMFQQRPRIELYGISMGSGTEYQYQRDGVTYWVGKARGAGIEVFIPPESKLMHARLYGYEGGRVIERQLFELRVMNLRKEHDVLTAELHQAAGKVQLLAKNLTAAKPGTPKANALRKEFDVAVRQERELLAKVSIVGGALQENEQYMRICDELLRAAGETGAFKEGSEYNLPQPEEEKEPA